MDEVHKKLLKEHQVVLLRDMSAADVVDHLVAGTLTSYHEQEIMREPSGKERNRKLLGILGDLPNSYVPFIAALKGSCQYELLRLLQTSEAAAASSQLADSGPVVNSTEKQPRDSRTESSSEMTSSLLLASDTDIRKLIELDEEMKSCLLLETDNPARQDHEPPLGAGRFGTIVYKYSMPEKSQFGSCDLAGKNIRFLMFDRNLAQVLEFKKTLQHVVHEIRVHQRLPLHDNILEFKAFCMEKDHFIIFTELMNGSVRKLIEDSGTLTLKQALNYISQAASGLKFLHEQKREAIIHRDIKCANMLVTGKHNDELKLADFGLAHILKLNSVSLTCDPTAPKSAVGTACFMAPEVLRKSDNPEAYGRKADIWSLACALFEMLTGNPPFSDRERNAYLGSIASYAEDTEMKSDDVKPLKKLLYCMFIEDEQERPTAAKVLSALRSVQNGNFSSLNELFEDVGLHEAANK